MSATFAAKRPGECTIPEAESVIKAAIALVRAKIASKGMPAWIVLNDGVERLARGGNWTKKELALYRAVKNANLL